MRVHFVLVHLGQEDLLHGFSPFRDERGFLLCQTVELNIDKLLIPLEDLKVGEVAGVVELFVSAACTPDGLRLVPSQAQPVMTPLRGPARGKKRPRASSEGSDSSEASSARSEDSAEAPFDKMYEVMQGSSTDSSNASVDTDADSVAEEMLASKKINQILSRHLPEKVAVARTTGRVPLDQVDSGSQSEEEDVGQQMRLPRHAPGTWKFWENTWFYMTKTHGFSDVKILIKQGFRNVTEGMGRTDMSKALTPHHFDDDWDDPWKTCLLLRSWSIWRARWQGWAKQKSCRLRELEKQVARFETDLRAAQAKVSGVLLLGTTQSEALLKKLVPDVSERLGR